MTTADISRGEEYTPLGRRENTFVSGCARFQFITERLVRLEWASDGLFEDRESLAVMNRHSGPVNVDCTSIGTNADGPETILTTGALTLRYSPDGMPFHAGNLSITVKFLREGEAVESVWKPGLSDHENLKGTIRTLDRMNGSVLHFKAPNANPASSQQELRLARNVDLGEGLISKSGWSLYDDSETACLEPDSNGLPVPCERRSGVRTDWYLLGYGRDYRKALEEAMHIFGRQPLLPRFAFGYWWSRFWAYTDTEFVQLVDTFDRMNIPLSVLVIDMDWHREGWTGYTWDRRFFPDPDGFLADMKSRGLHVSLNIHPHEGIRSCEEAYPEMARELGIDPETEKTIPFNAADTEFMNASFKHLHHPLEKKGVDFWWLDWQQGETTDIRGLDPLPWLNRLYWNDQERNKDRGTIRPMIFSRYGGLGSGRFPVGFSGDTYHTWESLSYQPYFTATAANVLYGYWSHDIGGHFTDSTDPELYLRWLQWGMYSPVLRTHAERSSSAERRVWEYPEPYGPAMAKTIRDRYELIPYIYTEAMKTFITGVSICRPLYYEYPETDAAYENPGQYLFGGSMIVSPVTAPSSHDGFSEKTVWLPEGEWIDTATGRTHSGGTRIQETYTPEEIPVFVRPGTIIPRLPAYSALSNNACGGFSPGIDTSYTALCISIYPGSPGEYVLYEDDGRTTGYLLNKNIRIRLAWEENGETGIFTIDPPVGEYEGFRPIKDIRIKLHCTPPVLRINAAERSVPFTYDGDELTVTAALGEADISAGLTVVFIKARSLALINLSGFPGVMRRMKIAMSYIRLLFSLHDCSPEERVIVGMAQTGRRIGLKPETCAGELDALRKDIAAFPTILTALTGRYPPQDKRYGYAQKAAGVFKASEGIFNRFIKSDM